MSFFPCCFYLIGTRWIYPKIHIWNILVSMDVEPLFIRPRSSWPCTACFMVSCRDVRGSQQKIFRHRVKLTACLRLKIGRALKGDESSSNHPFSGAMLVSRSGVDNLVLALFLFAVVYWENEVVVCVSFLFVLACGLKRSRKVLIDL